ncbi:MAG: hypothetical protein AAF802_22610, partial [Planctomycetota bacterium]
NLPEGVSVDRVVQTLSPDLGRWDPRGGYIYLQDIGSMRPGEMIEYQLVLESNQPQTFTITVEVVSQNTAEVARSTVQTVVVASP